jgi:hypothetical protein
MAITYGFFNATKQSDGTYDRAYNSNQISDMFEGLVSDGVFESIGDAMVVTAKSGMTVQVGTGRASIDGRWIKNNAKMDITLAASNIALNRWSAIVIRLNMSSRTMSIVEKVGTAATNPVKPSLTNSNTVKEKCLAYVYVKAGTGSITQVDITDMRANTAVCGWVTGVIKQVDTSQLFLQYQAAYERQLATMQAWETQQKAAFDTWFSALTDQLQVNTYIKKFRKAITTTTKQGTFSLDMSGYTYSTSDIIFVNVNGVSLIEDYDWIINTTKSPVAIDTRVGMDAGNVVEIIVLKSQIGQA